MEGWMTNSYNIQTVDFFANKYFINMYSKHIMEGQRKKNESYNENLNLLYRKGLPCNEFLSSKKFPRHLAKERPRSQENEGS